MVTPQLLSNIAVSEQEEPGWHLFTNLLKSQHNLVESHLRGILVSCDSGNWWLIPLTTPAFHNRASMVQTSVALLIPHPHPMLAAWPQTPCNWFYNPKILGRGRWEIRYDSVTFPSRRLHRRIFLGRKGFIICLGCRECGGCWSGEIFTGSFPSCAPLQYVCWILSSTHAWQGSTWLGCNAISTKRHEE